ncbi:nitrogenase molybdenum-iron cofactor biosynthesis radical SAM domain iron-sulfur cluster-binding oxidoreductase [Syntrophotalea carbinolica DSM 2380]|uniref:Nitrogenase molybdenum-iron cofactor biosynthesis radical SAM domain iron-sulfur cluster-binding oxidoreductase n=1 Tax=Syntrophotalea carbinolica (strain DSM 2380 / NBRC 103641 / GraBd1) TaxID=338963 RepID=Q3A2R0_SYNC1|nr:radical SAM protein [Syntrophotalea carbinolica]ABA89347.1 nitrogenase molybdenum-iron cofactor biosynthesis radical SAM domain iron-sulfur cluster-binding oxidoreductase [Syntrophotalea carbinolica DSM 2380]
MSAKPCSGNNRPAAGHPCFGAGHQNNARIHLPVAPGCNISCGFCERRFDCANENRPGVTSRVLSPSQALHRVKALLAHPDVGSKLKVVGIAGPGDPLANEKTFETLRLVKEAYPDLQLCLSTNGLVLPQRLETLLEIGVGSITVTMNAITPETGAKVYQWVNVNGTVMRGQKGASALIDAQMAGIQAAARAGMLVKVNNVYIPGVNDHETLPLAKIAKKLGASIMNILPLIAQGAFRDNPVPSDAQMAVVRDLAEKILPQSRHCKQCRADAAGVLGQDIDVSILDAAPESVTSSFFN